MTLTPKENLLRVIHHDRPEWVPNGMESVIRVEATFAWARAIDPSQPLTIGAKRIL